MASGLTPFGLSAAHSASRVGARFDFLLLAGAALAVGSLSPCLNYFAPIRGLGNSARIRSQAPIVFPRTAGSPNFRAPQGRNSIGRG